jgi:hypothetical protein
MKGGAKVLPFFFDLTGNITGDLTGPNIEKK